MRDFPLKVEHRYKAAVFIDRDGTINVDTHYPHLREDLQLIPGAAEGLRILSKLPVHIIVITNQAGIALNMYTKEQMSDFNTALREQIEAVGARIDAFYYCPHLERKNTPDNLPVCNCSKPSPGLLFEAANEFGINIAESIIIGDKLSDIAAGQNAGCKLAILVKTNSGAQEELLKVNPDYITNDLLSASMLLKTFFNVN